MKKVLFIAAAVAAMAACTKSEVVYDDNDAEIGLSPVNYKSTKVQYGPITSNMYPTSEDFGVFAVHTTSNAGTAYINDADANFTTYLSGVKFVHKGDRIWHGDPSYYWPKTGSLYFAGYSPAGTTGTVTYSFDKTNPSMKITDFIQGGYHYVDGTASTPTVDDYANMMIDLMWFDVTPNSYNAQSETPAVTFNHALSRLRFVLQAGAGLNDIFTIKKVTLKNVRMRGTMSTAIGQAPKWDLSDQNITDIELWNTEKVLPVDQSFQIADVLVIPQETSFIEIEYIQKPYVGATENIETKYSKQLTGGADVNNLSYNWIYSRYYTYSIVFTADEIEIKPDVAPWVEVPETLE